MKTQDNNLIHSELHNHFSPFKATALLFVLKAAVQVLLSLDIVYKHLQSLYDTQSVHTAETNPMGGTGCNNFLLPD